MTLFTPAKTNARANARNTHNATVKHGQRKRKTDIVAPVSVDRSGERDIRRGYAFCCERALPEDQIKVRVISSRDGPLNIQVVESPRPIKYVHFTGHLSYLELVVKCSPDVKGARCTAAVAHIAGGVNGRCPFAA